ncbi:MFS transporter [Phenylobacterium sp.]|uniref:spinster family MFS transporter n=1 Tax=Phenylobacterium sp. TaxID=1871053 RepID=UPI002F3FB172
MADTIASPASVPGETYRPAYRSYALGLLLTIYVLNCLDRQVINILAEPIKRELHLADWQVGIMSGVSFALIYTMLAVPIARQAEHRHRPAIIAAALAVWCGFTALCGLARTYVLLCLCRFGVGVGEAGCTPPALSLISDYFPKEKRATALGVYAAGAPLGVLLGMGFGGLVADAYGWRAAFLIAGAPGLILAALVVATLKEARPAAAHQAVAAANRPSVRETVALLASKQTFWLLSLAAGFKMIFTDGQAPFLASFFLRSHHDEVAALAAGFHLQPVGFLGMSLGLINGVMGVVSGWVGGVLADRAAARNLRYVVIAPAAAMLVATPAYIAALYVDSVQLAFAFLMIQCATNVFWAGPVYSSVHGVVPASMRATATAVLIFIINMLGTGVGPLFIGALSDGFSGALGQGTAAGLRSALTVASLVSLAGVFFYWQASRSIVADMETPA